MSSSSYVGPIYEPVGPVNAFHNVPRFGHTSNVTEIFSEDGLVIDTLVSYALGTIFIGGFLLTSYLVFLCLIFLFKCFCRGDKNRVFAGLPFIDMDEGVGGVGRKRVSSLKIYRGILLTSTFIIVVSGCVFLVNGTIQFNAVASDVRDGTQGFIDLSDKVEATADAFIALGEDSVIIRDSLKSQVDKGICESFVGGNSKPSDEFDDAALILIDILDGLQEFAKTEVTDIRDTFGANLEDRVDSVENTTDEYERILNPAFYAAPAIAFGFVFMTGIILSWVGIDLSIYFFIQTWVFIPLFFIFFTISTIIIVGVGIALVGNADICIGNPTGTPEGFMDIISKQFLDEPTQAAVDYYLVSGCRGNYTQLLGVEEILGQLPEAVEAARGLNEVFQGNKGNFELLCGGVPGSLDNLEITLNETVNSVDTIEAIAKNTTELLSCEDINQIWIDLMHDAVCTSAPKALAYMFGTMVAIYSVGMLIFLLRGALLPEVVEYGAEDSEYDQYSRREESQYGGTQTYNSGNDDIKDETTEKFDDNTESQMGTSKHGSEGTENLQPVNLY